MSGTYSAATLGDAGVVTVSGSTTGTGSAINVTTGFWPGAVLVVNKTRHTSCFWNREMNDSEGWKSGAKHLSTPYWGYVKGSANTDSENSDSASAPTNSAYCMALTAVSAGAWTAGTLTNPDICRNVGIVIKNDTGGNLNLFVGTMTFKVTGTDLLGNTVTDNITFTSTSGNKAIAHTPNYRYKYGVVGFLTITSITLDNVPDNGLKIACCLGSKVRLPRSLATPAAADVLLATDTTAGTTASLSLSSKTDTTNNTFNFGAVTDGDSLGIQYFARGERVTFVSSNAITPSINGFTIGTDSDFNQNSDSIVWTAWRP